MYISHALRSLPHPLYQLFSIFKSIVEFNDFIGIVACEVVVAVVDETEEQRDFRICNWTFFSAICYLHSDQLELRMVYSCILINILMIMSYSLP